MSITLRLETPADYQAVEELTREAFWGFMGPTCDEHYLVHLLRKASAFVPKLDYVAEIDGELVGNVMYSTAKIIDCAGNAHEVLTFGPLSVSPIHWHSGVGSALMRHTIQEATRMGYGAIAFYGHPDYYPRFGFRNAKAFGITTPDGKNFDAFMAMPLYDGALDGISGTFHEDPVFDIDARAAEAYDKNFSPKPPTAMLSIDVLLEKLDTATREAFSKRGITALAWLNRLSGREMMKWDGVNAEVMALVNRTLKEHGYAEKLLPDCAVLQLSQMGIRIPIISKIRMKDGISVYRVESEGNRFILKIFENFEDTREIENYKLLASLGIPTLSMLKYTQNALLLPDVEASVEYRLGIEKDLSDERVARAAARWYKTLHEKGGAYLKESRAELYDETDIITQSNMDFIAKKTHTEDNPVWVVVKERFDDIRHKIDLLPRTLTYNDFYWTNLVVSKDQISAMMLDFNLLGKGYAYGDIRNVTSSLTGEAKEAFLLEYGSVGMENEKIADAALSPLVTLYCACGREIFPNWANESLQALQCGALLKNLQQWLTPTIVKLA